MESVLVENTSSRMSERTVEVGGLKGRLTAAETDRTATGRVHVSLRTKEKKKYQRDGNKQNVTPFSQCLIIIIIIINNKIIQKKDQTFETHPFPLVIHVPFSMYPRLCSSCRLCQQFPLYIIFHTHAHARTHTHTYIYSYIERFVFVFLTCFFFLFCPHTKKVKK